MDGTKVQRLRYAQGLTLRDLAKRAGVAFYTIWSIEADRTNRPHPSTLKKLAAALGVEPRELLREDRCE